jgi:hypothetical protein
MGSRIWTLHDDIVDILTNTSKLSTVCTAPLFASLFLTAVTHPVTTQIVILMFRSYYEHSHDHIPFSFCNQPVVIFWLGMGTSTTWPG